MPLNESSEGGVPVVGDRVTVEIRDVGFGGEGVGRVDGFVVFVPFTVPGEEVEVELLEVKRQFGRGRLVRVVQPSTDRVEPRCPYFGECGGCQYQHMAYAAQLAVKQKQVSDLVQRIGGVADAVAAPVVPCPEPYGYRNRIMVRTQWDKYRQQLVLGFIRHDNRLVVDVEACCIADPALNEQLREVRRHPPPKGGLKVVLRLPPEGWEVPPDSFFQNNFILLPALVGAVRECLEASGVRHLIDAYCGVGFFSLELAGAVDSFAGVELDARAVQSARRNAERRGVRNGGYVMGETEALLPTLLEQFPRERTAVLLDPPRKGCRAETVAALLAARPRQVLYVSCHPATLARDLNMMCGGGVYRLARVVPLDMFPQTQHVECVADVRLAEGSVAGDRPK